MNAQASRIKAGPWQTSPERVAELLARYPKVSKDENREILEFINEGRHLEIGLLTSDEKLQPNLDAFMEDHKKHFRVSLREAAVVIAMIAAFILAVWLSWELRAPSSF